MPQIWAGVDIGKTHHHCVVLDAEGRRLLSRRGLNDEPELLALLADVLTIDDDVVWVVDVTEGIVLSLQVRSTSRFRSRFGQLTS